MKTGHRLDTVMTLILFGVFTASVLTVLMLGAKSYQTVASTSTGTYEPRTCLQYMATKIRHYSGTQSVSVTTFGEGDALALQETIDGGDYVTYLYLYQGQIMELFCEKGANLSPEAGFAILPMDTLEIASLGDNLLSLSCGDETSTAQLYVGLHLGEAVAYE